MEQIKVGDIVRVSEDAPKHSPCSGAAWMRSCRAMTRYFSLIGSRPNQNYLGAFIPVSQAFYAKGVRDYVDNRQQFDYALFQEKTRVFLTAKGFQNVNNRRYIDEIQLCCFDLQRRDNAVWESKTHYDANKLGAMKPMQYDWYIRALGLALITNKN